MKHILDFYKYNSIVRKKYLDAIDGLSWEEITKDRGASYPSIRDIFLHVLDAYRYWFEFAISGLKVREYKDVVPSGFGSVTEMRKYEEQVDSLVMRLVRGLRNEDLAKVYTVHSTEPDDPETVQISMETILMHMIEEELQHRGELNCLFWQADHDPPITGFGHQ
ncbi:hypothetical protein A3K71_02295 [archaeon RBG_16_50_20]|nr:MAG: hypothetical protein A3K71_02295 [archaeon RBG_16_50_20]